MTREPINAVDLFAGALAGGWDLACRSLGFDPLGIEIDDAACATREAAGLRTLQGDVAALDPLDFAACESLIASPPCQAFSSAGKGEGREDMPLVYEAARTVGAGLGMPQITWRDDRAALVVEPLRWALALEPRFIAWEQVKEVLPFWEFCAAILRFRGWSVWTGLLDAEMFGVPQTRRRAILLADREAEVSPPEPTHQRYMGKGHRKGASLFDPGRRVHPDDVDLLPWISMAEALGWAPDTIVNTRGDRKTDGGNEFTADRPSWALTEKTRSWTLRGNQKPGGSEDYIRRDADSPSITVTGNARSWVFERPSTAVCGDPRIFPPGFRGGKAEYAELAEGEEPTRAGTDAIRVSLEEAAVLQSFRPDYPFQGTKTQRFLQCGNAVPPLLATAILAQLLFVPAELERSAA